MCVRSRAWSGRTISSWMYPNRVPISFARRKVSRVLHSFIGFVALTAGAVGLPSVFGGENRPPIRFHSLTVADPILDQKRVGTVGQAVGFQGWPKTAIARVAPRIDKKLLSNPKLVTQENTSYEIVEFGDDAWCAGRWSWCCLVKNSQPLPAELPAKRKERLLAKLSPEKRNDPRFVEKYLKGKLDRYIESKRYRVNGEVDVRLCVAPNSGAAQEYLLAVMTTNTMPTEALALTYAAAERPYELGDTSFLKQSRKNDTRIKFVRDNICVAIRANGCFANEALPLARKIDAMLIAQAALTCQELSARKPEVCITSHVDHSLAPHPKTVSYGVSAPSSRDIACVRAYVDGAAVKVKDGKIPLAKKKGRVTIRLVAVTSELLANSVEQEVVIDE